MSSPAVKEAARQLARSGGEDAFRKRQRDKMLAYWASPLGFLRKKTLQEGRKTAPSCNDLDMQILSMIDGSPSGMNAFDIKYALWQEARKQNVGVSAPHNISPIIRRLYHREFIRRRTMPNCRRIIWTTSETGRLAVHRWKYPPNAPHRS